MPNANLARGFTPVRHYLGGTERLNDYQIASGLATAIFTGDPVKSTGTTKQITAAAANDAVIGVFQGVVYTQSDGEPKYSKFWPASTVLQTGSKAVALVVDDPLMVFEVQASAGFAVADIGAGADFVAAAGDTTTGQSAFQLNSASISTVGTLNLKILDLVQRPDNEFGTNAKVLVLFNKHELRAAVASV